MNEIPILQIPVFELHWNFNLCSFYMIVVSGAMKFDQVTQKYPITEGPTH